jgi:diguanylate cyclase (GGDEF)-like protein
VTDAARPASSDPLGVLAGVADALAHGDDLDATLRRLLDVAAGALGADAGAVFLQDPDRVGLEPAVAVGVGEPVFDRLRESLGRADDPIAATARDRSPVRATGEATGGFGALSGSRSAAFDPLGVTRGGIDLPLGVIALGWAAERRLTAADDTLLGTVARLASIAIDHGRLASLVAERSEWFERMAQSDPLTGLANQRIFARVLELELARAGRQGGEVSLALFDVDGFVATNEAGGHEAGDDVLRAVAAVLNESVRLVDTVARIGGDEFVLVAPGSAGMTVARRVLAGVAALAPVGGGSVSVSAGIARFPTDGTTPDELLEAAAGALAAAKGRGPATLHETSTQPAS